FPAHLVRLQSELASRGQVELATCTNCSWQNLEGAHICATCGEPVFSPEGVTRGLEEEPAQHTTLFANRAFRGLVRFEVGRVIAGRLRIVHWRGKGGMGEVFRADGLRLNLPVVLKFLRADLTDDPHWLAYFHEEVKLARQVTHPNVCRVHDIAEADGQVFL